MSWTKKITHPSEMLKKSETVKCVVLAVDEDKQRIALGLKQLHEDPWLRAVPTNYIPGQIVQGSVTKITNFGVFVELEPDLEGLLHISELADHKVEDPHNEVKIGDTLEVKAREKKVKPRRGGLIGPGEVSTDLITKPLVAVPPREEPSEAAEPAPEAASDDRPASEPSPAAEPDPKATSYSATTPAAAGDAAPSDAEPESGGSTTPEGDADDTTE